MKQESDSTSAYDFSQDSPLKEELLAKIKQQCFGEQSKVIPLTDSELQFASAAAKPLLDTDEDETAKP